MSGCVRQMSTVASAASVSGRFLCGDTSYFWDSASASRGHCSLDCFSLKLGQLTEHLKLFIRKLLRHLQKTNLTMNIYMLTYLSSIVTQFQVKIVQSSRQRLVCKVINL